jgi:hypothetical protein
LVALDYERVVVTKGSLNVIACAIAKGSRTLYCPRVFCCPDVFKVSRFGPKSICTRSIRIGSLGYLGGRKRSCA